MEERQGIGFAHSQVVFLLAATALAVRSLWTLSRAVRYRRHWFVVGGLWFFFVAIFCAAAALLVDVTGWTLYTPDRQGAGSHDPQAGVGHGLQMLLYNAALIGGGAVALATYVLVSTKRNDAA